MEDLFFFDLGFTALSRIFHLYRADRSSKVGGGGPLCGPSIYEPAHDKTNKMACAPSEDSDQPGHPPSLISLRCALSG